MQTRIVGFGQRHPAKVVDASNMEGSGVSSGSKSLMICLMVEYLLQVPKGRLALQHRMHQHPG
jgi:hypothetical protein